MEGSSQDAPVQPEQSNTIASGENADSSVGLDEAQVAGSQVGDQSPNASGAQLVRNTVWSYAGLVTGALSALVITPLILHELGAAIFGTWTLLQDVTVYIGLFDLGIGTAAVRRVAAYRATGDLTRVREVLATLTVLQGLTGLLQLVLTVVMAVELGSVFHLAPGTLRSAQLSLIILAVGQTVGAGGMGFGAAIYGGGRHDLQAIIILTTQIVISVAQVVVVLIGGGLIALGFTLVLGAIVNQSMTWLVLLRVFPDSRFGLRTSSRRSARELVRFGGRNAITTLTGTLSYGLDTILIGFILPVAKVSPYAIGSQVSNFVLYIAARATPTLIPTYSHSDTRGERDRNFRLFTDTVLFTLGIAFPLVLALIAFGSSLLHLWLHHVPASTYDITIVLCAVILLRLPSICAYPLLTGTEQNKILVRLAAPMIVFNVGPSIALTIAYGPIGPALGSLPNAVLFELGVITVGACRILEISYRRYAVTALFPLSLPVLLSGGYALALRLVAGSPSPWLGVVDSIGACAIFWGTMFFTIGHHRRIRWIEVLVRAVPRRPR